jgi:hypothetical protein
MIGWCPIGNGSPPSAPKIGWPSSPTRWSPPVATALTQKFYSLMLGFGLSIPVFFATTYGWVLWIAVPLLSKLLLRWPRRDGRGPEAASRA